MLPWNELKRIIAGWIRWCRLSRAVHWGLRGLALSLGAVFLIALVFVPWHWMSAFDYIVWVFWGSQIGLWSGFIIGFIWPLDTLRLIHSFDRMFGLEERVSTAIEVQTIVVRNLPGKDTLVKGWRDRQLADTLAAAKKVRPNKIKPFKWERKTLAFVYGMGLVLLVFWIVAQPQFNVTDKQRSSTRYLKTEMDLIQTCINEITHSDNLSQAQKDTLSAPYIEAKNKLQNVTTAQQAISVINQAQQKFQALSIPLSETQLQAVQDLGSIIGVTSQSPLSAVGRSLSGRDFTGAGQLLQKLSLKDLSSQDQSIFIEEFKTAGLAIKFTLPSLSQTMTDSAVVLQTGDVSTAQTSLEEAAAFIETLGNQSVSVEIALNAISNLESRKTVILQESIKGTQTVQSDNNNEQISLTPEAGLYQAGSVDNTGYESIYAPQVGEANNNNANLQDNAAANQVPYVDMLSSYNSINNQKIENGSVPEYLAPLVKDYFESISP